MSAVWERQALGAIRFIDAATSRPVRRALVLRADGLRFHANRRNLYGVQSAGLLDDYLPNLASGEAAGLVDPLSLSREVRVEDPSGYYLRRRFTLELPRRRGADEERTIFQAQDVLLLPSPRVSTPPNWAAIRVSLRRAGDGRSLGGCLVRAMRNGERIGVGMSAMPRPDDAMSERVTGEALLLLPNLPHVQWGDDETDPVLLGDVQVTLQLVPSALEAGATEATSFPDVDALLEGPPAAVTPSDAIAIRAGREVRLSQPRSVTVP